MKTTRLKDWEGQKEATCKTCKYENASIELEDRYCIFCNSKTFDKWSPK